MSDSNQNSQRTMVCIYGPPGSGKSSAGRLLAEALEIPFWDLDQEIEIRNKSTIPEIFAKRGEAGFRQRETKVLKSLLSHKSGVISLGGGSLLTPANREIVERQGPVICLNAEANTLLERLQVDSVERPLLTGDLQDRLEGLMAERGEHYASFSIQVDTTGKSSHQIAWEAQVQSGMFRVRGMGSGYDVRVLENGLDELGALMRARGLNGPIALVSDENVGPLYAGRVQASLKKAGYSAHIVLIPAGEQHKTVATVNNLWQEFIAAGLERGSTVVALGGGVVGDLAGFAAATFLRGISWVVAPTSLLAMVDASLGGKTGADLPEGKNLVGAFYPPSLVLADPQTLLTLPEDEFRSGMAEVVKHGVIGDPALFELCTRGWGALHANLGELVRRGMAVKVRVIQTDPFERGLRATLNLGHTLGHAVESTSNYRLRHGEAVAIGMVAATRLAVQTKLAEPRLEDIIGKTLVDLELPTEIPPGMDREQIIRAVSVDKKRSKGKTRFVLPVRIGEVQYGIEIEDWQALVRNNQAGSPKNDHVEAS